MANTVSNLLVVHAFNYRLSLSHHHQNPSTNKVKKQRDKRLDENSNSLVKIQVCAMFRARDIRRNVLLKFVRICIEKPCFCPCEWHKYGCQKLTKYVIEFCTTKPVETSIWVLSHIQGLLRQRNLNGCHFFLWPWSHFIPLTPRSNL